jgi:hypothetical protein
MPRLPSGEMSAKCLAIFVPVLVFVSTALAQVNEVSVTAGRTFVSTTTIQNPPPNDPNPNIHFANPPSLDFGYARFLLHRKIFALYGEVPVGIYFRMNLNTYADVIPRDIGALFVTPSARLNIFASDSVTPWVSAGGGYGRFREAPYLVWAGLNPGPRGTNTGVVQFGAGLDVWFWHDWGARFEARDFYSGVPDLNVDTDRSRQHNYYVGVGVAHRF